MDFALSSLRREERDGERRAVFTVFPLSSVLPMNLTLRHVVPALAGAIAIRKTCSLPANAAA